MQKSGKSLGKLKWGVGKLIAHAPTPPVVIPFFHMGMETILPQHPDTKTLVSRWPHSHAKVDVIFGNEVKFDDLIEEHERIFGPLWKYRAQAQSKDAEKELQMWKSSNSDKILYHRIAFRLQAELERLNVEMNELKKRKY